ncbi:MAG: mercury resistance system transport protein MerF [Hyphomicrobiales bacterium]
MDKPDKTKEDKMLRSGLVGSVIAAICCFTPLLVIAVAGVGLSAVTGWLDYGLFPMLFASMGVTAQALYLRFGSGQPSPKTVIVVVVAVLSGVLIWLQFRYALRISVAAALAVYGYWYYLRRAELKQRTA